MVTYDGPINILLVDDHPDNLLALEAVLGDLNYNLVKCLSGEEALRSLLREEFAVILLDVQMPEMDGFETARLIKMREKTRETPIIFISATSKESEHFFTGYEVGAIDYMLKPFVPQILRTKIEGFVRMYIGTKTLQLQTELLHQKTRELEKMNRELMRTAYQLNKTQALARAVQETSSDTMVTFDREGRILAVNPALTAMFGYLESEVIGTPIEHLIPCFEGGGFKEPEGDAKSGMPTGKRIELAPMRKDGSRFPAEIQVGVATVDDDRIYACTISDMTERKQFELDLMKAKDAAEIAARAKTDFLAMVSHEIRTPMNGVLGMTELLLETGLSPEQQDYAEIIHKSGDALLSVINDILDYAKIESGKLEVEEMPFQLDLIVSETFELFTAKTKQLGLHLAYELDPGLPKIVIGDGLKLRQVLINLVGNAVKFTPKGSIRVEAKLGRMDEDAIEVQFAVHDTGVGIPEEKLPLLFQPFSQVDTSLTRRYGGTGLGLAICKNLVELMRGTIHVETNEAAGATFRFTVTVKPYGEEGYWNQEEGTDLTPWMTPPGWFHEALSEAEPTVGATEPPVDALTLVGSADAMVLEASAATPGLTATLPAGTPAASAGRPSARAERPGLEGRAPSRIPEISFASLFEAGSRELSCTLEVIPEETSPAIGAAAPQVLVADDNEINQKLTIGMLEKLGIRADVAADGGEAVAKSAANRYALILMDMRMPVMDGLEATRQVLAANEAPHTPVVVAMTANVLPADRQRCLEAGMADFLAKPLQFEAVKRLLQRYRLLDTM
ncbi:response regulator [Paenibacillus xanthanilyticus]|uniref:histidine kinase n=2 Tax=Paenibacillus xanthanilyticus TaxID=1783531 RepID=A0ABV8K3H6_9BACL